MAAPNGPPPALIRDALATAAAIDNGVSLPPLLAAVTRSDGKGFKAWQFAAVGGALDSLDRRGQVSAEVRTAIQPVVAYARTLCEKEDAPEAELLAAVPLLGRDPETRAGDVPRLAALLAANRPAAVQAAALTTLSRTPDVSVSGVLVKAWAGASPALRGRLLDALMNRPTWRGILLDAVEKGTIPANQFDAARRQQLANASDKATRDRAAKVFAGGSNADRQKVIDDYTSALSLAGDKTRGKVVFAKSCAACHVLDGVGHAVGPDLATLANKSPLYLLSEVFDPSRNLDSRFAEYRATLKDGRVVTGLLAAETATGITLRGQQAKDETILRGDVETLLGTAKSLMPEGLEKDVSKQDAADLIAYLTATDPPHKTLAGNSPAEIVASDNALTLPAAKAFVYGRDITFETEFGNIGYWHGETDHVAWKVRLDRPAAFDVYLDAACANDSAGGAFALDTGGGTLRGKVAGTGGWDRYALTKLGTANLPAGPSRITFRPDGPVRGALIDLRTLYLVPVGAKPTTAAATSDKPLSPAEVAKAILDPATPAARRESLVKEAIPHAAAVVKAMTADLPEGDAKEEYRRIPWVWRVSIAAGKANDAGVLRALLDVSLPNTGEPLRHWQAVVIGGGVINGLSTEGVWPKPRVAELLSGKPELAKRWAETLKLSHAMADDEKVPHGTRYDALRIVALDDWAKAEPRLVKYLVKTANAELQQGAVSGLVDVDHADAVKHLVKALSDLSDGNRAMAVVGLLPTAARANALLGAVENGSCKVEWLDKNVRDALRRHPDAAVRTRAGKVLGK
jgi:putative heme-binding domain-containing protein